MKTLLEFLELGDMVELQRAADLLERDLSAVLNRAHNMNNPVSKFPQTQNDQWGREGGNQHTVPNDMDAKLDQAIKRLGAARTGLGLTNKLKDPAQRQQNKSRIMKNLNLLRLIVQHVEEELGKSEQKPINTPGDQREPVGAQAEPYMGGTAGMGESIDPKLVDAVKNFKHAQKEVEKNPFGGKKKKAKKEKAVTVPVKA